MSNKQFEVQILGQTYRLAGPADKEQALRESAARVDAEMQKVRDATQVRGHDRIAVMAALTITSELLSLQRSINEGEAFPVEEIRAAVQKIDQSLERELQTTTR